MDTSLHFSTARQKLNETKLNERFHFCIPLKRATFLSRAVQSHPMNPLNYGTDIMLNYYSPVTSSQHSSCKVYTKGGLTNSLCNDRRWSKCKSTDMIMHKRINCLFAWKNLFANQKSGLSGLFCDQGSLVLSQNLIGISVAVQLNDFKIFFTLSSTFQYTKILLQKLRQPWNLLEF